MSEKDAKLLIKYEGNSSIVKEALDNMFQPSHFIGEIPIQGKIKDNKDVIWFETENVNIL